MTQKFDMGMTANGAIAALVAITAPSGYVEFWAAPIIGFVAGVIVVGAIVWIDHKLDDPVGALSAHGIAGIWGTLACGLFTSPRLAELNAIGDGGLFYTGSFHQLGVQAVGVAAAFTIGVRRQLPRVLGDQEGLRPAGESPRRSATASTSSSTACGAIPRRSCRSRDRSTVPRRCRQGWPPRQPAPVTHARMAAHATQVQEG